MSEGDMVRTSASQLPKRFLWDGTEFRECHERHMPTILVADSWRSSNGEVVAFALHRKRFQQAMSQVVKKEVANRFRLDDRFWSSMNDLIMQFHNETSVFSEPEVNRELFPRVWLGKSKSDFNLYLDVRIAPKLRTVTKIQLPPVVDKRVDFKVKGPDISWLASQKVVAIASNADDIALADKSGNIVEATTGNLIAWSGRGVLVPPKESIFCGITLELVLARCQRLGIPVEYGEWQLEEFIGYELWFLNSLHGISPVDLIHRDRDLRYLSFLEEEKCLDRSLCGEGPAVEAWQDWWLSLTE